MKAGLLASGALIWAAPVFAQAQDPLAPLPAQSPPAAPSSLPAPVASVPATAQSTPSPAPGVAAPKNWRGVFDAIDAGNWSAARAGIAALPASVLTPVAKAELYTAKGSPVVDLNSLQALIVEAPELPQANQLALLAYKRGATQPPSEKTSSISNLLP